MEQFLDCSA